MGQKNCDVYLLLGDNREEVCIVDPELLIEPHLESTEEVFAGLKGGEELVGVGFPPAEGYVAVEPGFSDAVPDAGDESALKE
ncbi:hypothetical protein BGZ96_011563, partial [Linnemannia gamsii]